MAVSILPYTGQIRKDTTMGAFFGDFLFEVVRMVCLMAVAVGAIFCGKKLRDRKDANK